MPRFAHPIYDEIQSRLLDGAIAALMQANQHAVFSDPGNEHWESMSIVNAAHSGELFIKAAIAKVHPLLIFQNVFDLDRHTPLDATISLEELVKRGKSHDFGKLPQILWATTARRIGNLNVFKETQEARNSIQHFVHSGAENLGDLSLKFIYEVIDPLILDEFGMYAIEHHEDHGVGYDYIVDAVIRSGLKFSIPPSFDITEISLFDSLQGQTEQYKSWLVEGLEKIGKGDLLKKPRLT